MATINDMPAHTLERIIFLAATERWRATSSAAALKLGLTAKRWAEPSRRVAWHTISFGRIQEIASLVKLSSACVANPSRLLHLRSLHLVVGEDDQHTPPWLFGVVEGSVIMLGLHATGLRNLVLGHCGRLSPVAAAALARRRFRYLLLSSGEHSDAGRLLKAVLDGPSAATLRCLDVRAYERGFRALDLIVGSHLPALTRLILSEQETLDHAGAISLSTPSLVSLNASGQVIDMIGRWTTLAAHIKRLDVQPGPPATILGAYRSLAHLVYNPEHVIDRAFLDCLPTSLRHLEIYFDKAELGLRNWLLETFKEQEWRELDELWIYGVTSLGFGHRIARRPAWLKQACEDYGIELYWFVAGPEDSVSDPEDDE